MQLRNRHLFFSRLAVLLGTGLGLDRALELCANKATIPGDRAAIVKLRDAVVEGRSLGAAVGEQGDHFSPLDSEALLAADEAHTLPATVKALAVALEREHARRQSARPVGIYLTVLTVIGLAALVFLRVVFMSQMASLFQGWALPSLTTFSFSFSTFMIVALAIYLVVLLSLNTVAPGVRDSLLAALPWLNRSETTTYSAAFARSLSLLLEIGIPVPRAVRLAAYAVSNRTVQAQLAGMEAALKEGGKLGETLARARGLHPLIADMAALGEARGKPSPALSEAAEELENNLAGAGRFAVNVSQGLALAAVVITIAVMAVGMYLPIFSLAGGISG